MQSLLASLLLSLSLPLLTTAATTCTNSGALSWPPVGDCSTPSRFDTIVETCRACCLNDADCFQACLKAAGLGTRDAMGQSDLGTIPNTRGLSGRADTLSCDVNEGCYQFTDGSLLCLNLGTGLYHDDVGGNGDYFSGEYTSPDGKVQTGTSAATATGLSESSPATSQTARSTAPAQTTSAGAARTSGSASGSSAVSPSAASATSLAGRNAVFLGANVGLVGLLAGLVI